MITIFAIHLSRSLRCTRDGPQNDETHVRIVTADHLPVGHLATDAVGRLVRVDGHVKNVGSMRNRQRQHGNSGWLDNRPVINGRRLSFGGRDRGTGKWRNWEIEGLDI